LVEDYPKVYSVNIKSRAKIHLPPGLMILQNPADDEAQVSIDLMRLSFKLLQILIAFGKSVGLCSGKCCLTSPIVYIGKLSISELADSDIPIHKLM
jgi:hypothetical protein